MTKAATKAPLKKAGATKATTAPAKPVAAKPATKAAPTKAPTKKGATKVAGPKATAPGAKQAPVALENGLVANMAAVRAALRVYAPGDVSPENDVEAVALLREKITARITEVGQDDALLCGDQADATTGCRGVGTTDVVYCPFCGEDFNEAEHAPASIVGTTETGLDAQRHELDEALKRFAAYSRDLVGNYYDIGVVLRDIQDRELWKATGSDSFKAFIEKELKMSRTNAYRYMDITKNYDRDTFLEIGPKKLELISGLPSEEREAALEAARNGSTARELASGSTASEGGTRGEAPARATRDSSAPPKGKNEITLIGKVGGKAEVLQFRNGDTGRVLKQWKPGAYLEHHISDDVVVRVVLKEVKGEPGVFEGATIALVRAV
jgi:hypothetical protein